MSSLAAASWFLDDPTYAAELGGQLERLSGELTCSGAGFHGAVDHYRGLLSTLRGDYDRAEECFAAAERLESGMDHAPRVCRTLMAWAEAIERRSPDDPDAQRRALDLLDRAVALAAERDLPRTLARAVRATCGPRRVGVSVSRRVAAALLVLTGCSVTSGASVTTTTTVPAVVTTVTTTTAAPPARPRAPTGDSVETITHDGIERRYLLHVPTDLPVDRMVPLVLVLHGAGGDPEDIEAGSGWNAVADERGMVVAYPEGDGGDWNAGACCGSRRPREPRRRGLPRRAHRSSRRLRADRSGARRASSVIRTAG